MQLAEYMTKPANGRLYRTLINRMWNAFFGRGIIGSVDDMDQKALGSKFIGLFGG